MVEQDGTGSDGALGLSPERTVLVVGAGFAGVAAAWAASLAGARIKLVEADAGSSALYSGLADGVADADSTELARALGLQVTATPTPIATREGTVRMVTARASGVLDLSRVAGREVRLLDVQRDDWDAPLLAKQLSASAWARSTNTRFNALQVDDVLLGFERRIASYDLAERFEAGPRKQALIAKLQAVAPSAAAWLTGPWLGLERDLATELSQALGCPVGECSSPPGGVAGARFERQRATLLRSLGVTLISGRALTLSETADSVCLKLADGHRRRAHAAVLAIGGVAAGGVRWLESTPLPPRFALSVAVDSPLWLDGEILGAGSSTWGANFERLGLSALERIGLAVETNGRVSGLMRTFACGDVLAGRARSVFAAIGSGIAAGRAAARRD